MVNIAVLYPIFNVLTSTSDTEELLRSLKSKTFKDKFQDPVARQFINRSLPCLVDTTTRFQNESIYSISSHLWSNCFVPAAKSLECTVDSEEALIKLIIVSFAIKVLLIMTCCKTRKSSKTKCCWGRPSPIVPLNMLDSYANRYGYMFAFGVTVNSCFDVLFGNYIRVVGEMNANKLNALPAYFSVFIKISLAFFICIIAYPFFIAQNMRNKLVGSLLGFTYSFLYFVLLVDKHEVAASKCWPIFVRINQKKQIPILIFDDLPRFACLLALMILFGRMFIISLRTRYHSRLKRRTSPLKQEHENWKKSYMYIHVQEVFKKHILKREEENLENFFKEVSIRNRIMDFITSKLYKKQPGFKYSTKIMIASFVGVLSVYLVINYLVQLGYVVFIKTWNEILNGERIGWLAERLEMPLALVEKHMAGLQTCWWLALASSTIIYGLVLLNSLVWYRRHVLMLRKGDRSFLPSSIKKETLDSKTLMSACFKFAGFQVGYSSWGYLIVHFVFWLLSSFLSVFLVVPLFYGGPSFLITLIEQYWPSAIIAVITIIIQGEIASRCFLISQENVSVDNRRAFHVASYVLFFFNVFIGVVSCILRIAYGGILGVIMLPRLPKSTLPRSYERRDPGYLAYLGFLMVEHQHSNPTLQCFVRILLGQINKRLTTDEFFVRKRSSTSVALNVFGIVASIKSPTKEEEENHELEITTTTTDISNRTSSTSHHNPHPYRQAMAVSRSARIRWHLAVMLVQNPSLRAYRGHFLRSRRGAITQKRVAKGLFLIHAPTTIAVGSECGLWRGMKDKGIFEDQDMGIASLEQVGQVGCESNSRRDADCDDEGEDGTNLKSRLQSKGSAGRFLSEFKKDGREFLNKTKRYRQRWQG